MTLDVYFYEAFAEEEQALRARLPASIRAGYTSASVQAAGHASPPAPLISIRTQSAIPDAWRPALRGVLARTTGYDHLLGMQTYGDKRPVVACLPEYCSRAVAEQAALLWLALMRRLPAQQRQWGAFNRDGLTGDECAGRTLAVVGVGRIGHEIVRIGRGLGMTVLGIDPVRRHADVDYVSWAEAAPHAHVVVASMNLTFENRGYFSATSLAGVRKGCVFINVARGELVETADLQDLLHAGILGGVALDVFSDEPHLADRLRGASNDGGSDLEAAQALARMPNVILTPHNAFNTREALGRKAEYTVAQVTSFLDEGRFRWPLDAV